MSIKVIIERVCKPGMGAKLPELLRELRSEALRQKGYVFGETLQSLDNQDTFLVVSTWSDVAAWQKWSRDPYRHKMETAIEPFLLETPKVKLYSEYFDSASAIERKR